MSDFRKKVDQVLDNLEMLLKNWQPEKVLATKVTKHSVKLNLRYSLENDSYLGIDLLPAYDILGHKRDREYFNLDLKVNNDILLHILVG